MDYPAELVDELCGIIERARKGKMHKTRAYYRALNRLLDSDRETPDAFEAITACAWAHGADSDTIDILRLDMADYFGKVDR
jgi:hypothetical protein